MCCWNLVVDAFITATHTLDTCDACNKNHYMVCLRVIEYSFRGEPGAIHILLYLVCPVHISCCWLHVLVNNYMLAISHDTSHRVAYTHGIKRECMICLCIICVLFTSDDLLP